MNSLLIIFCLLISINFTYASEISSEDDALDYSYLGNIQQIKDNDLEDDWINISYNKNDQNISDSQIKVKAALNTAGKIGSGILYQIGKLFIKKAPDMILKTKEVQNILAVGIITHQAINASKSIKNMYNEEIDNINKGK